MHNIECSPLSAVRVTSAVGIFGSGARVCILGEFWKSCPAFFLTGFGDFFKWFRNSAAKPACESLCGGFSSDLTSVLAGFLNLAICAFRSAGNGAGSGDCCLAGRGDLGGARELPDEAETFHGAAGFSPGRGDFGGGGGIGAPGRGDLGGVGGSCLFLEACTILWTSSSFR